MQRIKNSFQRNEKIFSELKQKLCSRLCNKSIQLRDDTDDESKPVPVYLTLEDFGDCELASAEEDEVNSNDFIGASRCTAFKSIADAVVDVKSNALISNNKLTSNG